MAHRLSAGLLVLVLISNSGGCGDEDRGPFTSFSFENDLEGWSVRALDVTHDTPGGPEDIPWHIVRSTARAWSGSTSLELYFFNKTDAAKIWIERPFALQPDADYEYEIDFAFYPLGNQADGNALFCAARSVPPATRDEIVSAVIGGTGAGSFPNRPWARRQAHGRVRTDAMGRAFAFVGVWGTFEIPYTYYLDDVRIRFRAVSGIPAAGPTSPAGAAFDCSPRSSAPSAPVGRRSNPTRERDAGQCSRPVAGPVEESRAQCGFLRHT